MRFVYAAGIVLLLLSGHARAAGLASDLPSGQPVATTVTWTVTGEGAENEAYRLSVKREGEPLRVMYDYTRTNVFEWTPIDEGDYFVLASVIDLDTDSVKFAGKNFNIGPRDAQAVVQPVVTASDNPLVAVYSAPACPVGAEMYVSFISIGGDPLTASRTNRKPCLDGLTMNFYIGGMRESTTYVMRHQVFSANGAFIESGPWVSFQTGSLPPNLPFPTSYVTDFPDSQTSREKFVLISSVVGNAALLIPPFPYAVDILGNVVWYNPTQGGQTTTRPAGNGNFMTVLADETAILQGQSLWEFDLAGKTRRMTTVLALNRQLEALGVDTINSVHHEARPLPRGRTAVIGSVEKILTDVQGPGPVDILGDMILILDENFQVEWTWNSFDHLDVTRVDPLEEVCTESQLIGCPPLFLDVVANDWTHANAIAYSPSDGNLLLSVRHQDWVIKIDYQDGNGSGNILWRFGPEGDFTIDSLDPYPWNSHQHDVNLSAPDVLALFDNGNTRCDPDPVDCVSRGQVYQFDETNMTATHLLNTELPEFVVGTGSAQVLLNGNYHFNSGLLNGLGPAGNASREITLGGETVYALETNIFSYRSHRMVDLYSLPPSWGVNDPKPNMIVIMVDDLDEPAFDHLLSDGRMPNLKTHLIDKGVRFENSFVTNSMCCPSRATYLTGMYSHNTGVLSNLAPDPASPVVVPGILWPGWFPKNGNPGLEETTIATELRAVGYHTGFIGKYLNGYGIHAPDGVADPQTYIPPGWDHWQGLIDPLGYKVYEYPLNDNGTLVTYGSAAADYQTDVLADFAADYIRQRSQQGQTPFFLTIAPLAPHLEILNPLSLQVPAASHVTRDATSSAAEGEFRSSFKGRIREAPRHSYLVDGDQVNDELPSLLPTPSFNEVDVSDKPSCPPSSGGIPIGGGLTLQVEPLCTADLEPMRVDVEIPDLEAQYKSRLASMLAVDDLIGTVVAALQANGLLDNTVLVFTSDNGFHSGEHRLSGKTVAYEESIRVPLVIRAPGSQSGVSSTGPVLNNDLAPTLGHLAKVKLSWDPDGASLVPLLINPSSPSWHRKSFLVEHWFVPTFSAFEYSTFTGLRSIDSNLDSMFVEWRSDLTNPGVVTDTEFYNLQTDPYQIDSVDLLPQHADAFLQFIDHLTGCAGASCRDFEALAP